MQEPIKLAAMDALKHGPPEQKCYPEPGKECFEDDEKISESTCRRNICFLLLFVVLGTCSVLVGYLVAINRGHVKPFLPFISESGGSPPQNGIFCILLFLMAITGSLLMTFRYYSVMKLNTEDDWKLRWCNKLGYAAGILSTIGLVITAAYPINMTHQKEEWYYTTLIPHLVGATTVYVAGVSYISSQTLISLFFVKRHPVLFIIRFFLVAVCLATFAPCNLSFLEVVKEMNPKYSLQRWNSNTNGTTTTQEGQIAYSKDYIICSASEWVLTICLILFMATFFKDVQSISMKISFNFLPKRTTSVISTKGGEVA